MKSVFKSVPALIYFILVMWWVILLLAFVPFGLLMDIQTIRSSGFATPGIGMTFVGIFGLLIGLSLVVPAFRKMYYVLPWLFPYVKIFYINVIIFSVAVSILNYGYEVQNSARHTLFFILMLVQIFVSRLAMSYYFHKRPVKSIGGRHER